MAALLLFVAAALMTGTAVAADYDKNTSEPANVSVTVSSTIAVDVKPDSLTYGDTEVGSFNGSSSANNFTAIEVENTGSEYIDRIWLNTTEPASDPFGTGSAANYDAGNFMQVKVVSDDNVGVTSTSEYHFINRLEYLKTDNSTTLTGSNFESDIPSYLKLPTGSGTTSRQGDSIGTAGQVDVGRLRMGNEDFFFIMPHAETSTCDGTNNAFIRLANVSQTDTRLGTVDFRDSASNWRDYSLQQAGSSSFGITTGGSTSGLKLNMSDGSTRQYDLLTNCDESSEQPHVYMLKYNVNARGIDDVSNTGDGTSNQFVLDDQSQSGALAPGDAITLETGVQIPEGVAQGSVTQGKLRVLVTADTTLDTS